MILQDLDFPITSGVTSVQILGVGYYRRNNRIIDFSQNSKGKLYRSLE